LIKIAHRGNVLGPSHKENQPSYLLDAIGLGYDVEVDIWMIKDRLWLGHDGPQYLIEESFLSDIGANAWFHCKNIEVFYYFNSVCPHLNYFWHQADDFTLTSQGRIWTYPGKPTTDRSIIVDILGDSEYKNIPLGICSDYVGLI